MKQVINVILVVNPLPCCHSSKNGAASRSTLPKGIDEAGDLLIGAGLLVHPTVRIVGGAEGPVGCRLAGLAIPLVLIRGPALRVDGIPIQDVHLPILPQSEMTWR